MTLRYLSSLTLSELERAARAVPYEQLPEELYPGVDVWIRRDDLLDPLISGNKAYKLLFNLIEAREQGAEKIITCGGAWSNHIHAVAAAGRRFGFQTIGIIRGERPKQLSATLQDAERFGMELRFVTRDLYRQRSDKDFLNLLGLDASSSLFIPEGGANLAGAQGAKFLARVIKETAPLHFDQVWLACGTGLTLAGVQAGLTDTPVIGVPVLKAGRSIFEHGMAWLKQLGGGSALEPLREGYECGGYARVSPELSGFIRSFERLTGVPLDPVYTAKLAFGFQAELKAGRVTKGKSVLLLHSGGLQGRRGLFS
ncbi:1-aminocyclopropane-1-carboxylate deaminase/D-cysteine desulfhydrase [Microbulbifer guangxiensis]|uniref:1-aminocyclopropane-1-carboxylate deaminase/D-cysteine desulfhydrase n=1 Tax=Microbulbifer guangxiensis TaxID=2904249 RepID=UPI001F488E92|nr:pyridoxal-phosphate dependent enzyme [Microbulbifer guangxiensis]